MGRITYFTYLLMLLQKLGISLGPHRQTLTWPIAHSYWVIYVNIQVVFFYS